MRRASLIAGLCLLVVSLYVVRESIYLDYYTPIGPGPGFFPLWLGVILAALSITWIAQTLPRSTEPAKFALLPKGPGRVQILALTAALMVFTAALDQIGYRLAMLGFLLFTQRLFGERNLLMILAIPIAGSFGIAYSFESWLGVYLPTASIELLQGLGL